ncbi:unnamed protein product [Cylindrotheca closterium]|uniref:C2 domain-containing protein n=1 Tax=Cylindrotheca closterium TaxID=2856 RepID=A0AAD2GE47_9STRA|nr:unnamed protein product [Cylindrotheca closterium]
MPTFPFRSNKGDKNADTPSSPNFSSKLSNLKSQGEKKLNEAASKGKNKLGLFKKSDSNMSADDSGKGSTSGKISALSEDSLVADDNNINSDDNDSQNQEEEEEGDEGDTSEIFIADRRGHFQKNNGSGMGSRFERSLSNRSSSSLGSNQSEADAFFIQGGARQSQHSKLLAPPTPAYTSSGRSVPRMGAVSLEAHMSLKYSKATGFPTKWFKAYVILDMDTSNRGAIKIYPSKPNNTADSGPSVSSRSGRAGKMAASKHQSTRIGATDLGFLDQSVKPLLEIPASMNWIAKDYENSSRRFVVEIPSEAAAMVRSSILYSKMKENKVNTSVESEMFSLPSGGTSATNASSDDVSDVTDMEDMDTRDATDNDDNNEDQVTPLKNTSGGSTLLGALTKARQKKEPFRLHFQCLRKGGNEKQVWMTAFEELGRLSFNLHKRVFGLGRKWKDPCKHERIRVKRDDKFAKQAKLLSTLGKQDSDVAADETLDGSSGQISLTSLNRDGSSNLKSYDDDSDSSSEFGGHAPLKANFRLTNKTDSREFMVHPTYAYPNKWMTHSEIYNEMLKPSLVYHDLRVAAETRKEIGTVRVEILECSGLPSLDWNSETDAVVYLVCGSYAFTSDVIQNKLNPVWLPRSRRACIFPLFHAYAKVFAGVFDDDGPGQKDDFAGRIVLDLAKCRPGSTYDVALPLRKSSQVYSRRARGVIRLRFSIDYTSHQAAILSYLPERKFNDPDKDNSVSVLCYDETSFRNITLTVHGEDLPGKFTTPLMKATTREIHFLRKVATNALQETVFDIIFWKNRSFSALCFVAWMHCCYLNSFGLVPFYGFCFLLLIMMQNYAFYGSDGRVQQGFVPPSFEEMAMALAKGKPIEPLYVRPHRDEASALKSEKTLKTHDEKAKNLLQLLGFKSSTEEDQPEDYHIEFPLSRAIRHPITEEYLYPKFSIKDCKVVKKSQQSKNDEDDDRSYSIEIMAAVSSTEGEGGQLTSRLGTAASNLQAKFGDTLDRGRGRLEKGKEMLNQTKEMTKEMLEMQLGNPNLSRSGSNGMMDANFELAAAFQRLPKNLQIQDQNIDVPEISEKGEKKKIIEELYDVRNEFHGISKFAFLDKTHTIAQKDPIYFGGKQSKNCTNDLDKLLGLGTHGTTNPVKSMIAAHMAPLVSAIQAFLHAIRCLVNITTWQDPILSFWVSVAIFAAAMVSLIFPFQLFFVFVGIVVLGPQNWVFITYVRPHFREEISEMQQNKRIKKLARAKKKKVYRDIPTNQPIITSHTSDNSPPLELALNQVDKRGIHQVSVPYSQLTYRRDTYWPPQPEYGRCDPDVRGFERSMQRMQQLSSRKSTIGVPAHVMNSNTSATKRMGSLTEDSES